MNMNQLLVVGSSGKKMVLKLRNFRSHQYGTTFENVSQNMFTGTTEAVEITETINAASNRLITMVSFQSGKF